MTPEDGKENAGPRRETRAKVCHAGAGESRTTRPSRRRRYRPLSPSPTFIGCWPANTLSRTIWAHPAATAGVRGVVIRALAANAARVECVLDDGRAVPLDARRRGALGSVQRVSSWAPCCRSSYRLRITLRRRRRRGSAAIPTASCPRSATSISICSTKARTGELWKKLGAHVRTVDGVARRRASRCGRQTRAG